MIEINDNISINRKFVRMTNPLIATYFAELADILKQVERKKTFNVETGFWTVNRKFIQEEIGIEPAEQRNCDQALVRLGIVEVNEKDTDKIKVDMKQYYELLAQEEIDASLVLPKTAKLSVAEKKAAKKEGLIINLAKTFGDDLDEETVESVKKLIGVYYDSKGWRTKAVWQPKAELVRSFAKDSSAVKELAEYMAVTGWSSFPDMIDKFVKENYGNATKLKSEQKTCTGTMEGVAF